MIKVRNLFWFISLLLLLTYPVWRSPIAHFLEPPGEIPGGEVQKTKLPRSLDMEGVNFSQFIDGVREWHIAAAGLHAENAENDLYLEQVRAQFTGTQSTAAESLPETNIRCGRSSYEREKNLLTLQENVVVTTEDGYEMHTALLRYLEDTRQLHADSGVRIHGRGVIVEGRELVYNIDSQYLQVTGQVVAEIF
jgi:LPS export ABC transporter protein LptC